ncbi:MAG: sporulation protein YabP [Firmicutes bacterium]|nr:sporulation protein YabP [Bacillota bacterium]
MPEEKQKAREMGPVHRLVLAERKRLSLEGVQNVAGFTTEEIALETTAGALFVRGRDLHLQLLNLDEGRMEVDGLVTSLVYAEEDLAKRGRSFLRRLLR